jgi:predicted small lipoprotein YifL
VKPLFYLPRVILICSAFAMTGMLSACGQTGPLYLPRVPADPDAPPGAVTQPVVNQNQQQRMPLPGASQSTPVPYSSSPFSR